MVAAVFDSVAWCQLLALSRVVPHFGIWKLRPTPQICLALEPLFTASGLLVHGSRIAVHCLSTTVPSGSGGTCLGASVG